MPIAIRRGPDFGTPQRGLALIRDAGIDPAIAPNLVTGWTRPQSQGLFADVDLTPHAAFQTTRSPAVELGSLDLTGPEETIFQTVFDLLPRLLPAPLLKEDGALVIDARGHRV